ncbi:hypothetical protein FHX52_2545 [Humibacillus xanthopallidus]|uniref:LVIVD repeat-containing protein n=1 Tax=Humibacillus xanthopallidus TaxID=412689 RepID=A0A543PP39_9MICO|nr:hypothetical protein [Humibacillus xanthopallidus]TQN45845.1 hypothetical protein FHX52_2545 [Humibacillus xanthopallidus]
MGSSRRSRLRRISAISVPVLALAAALGMSVTQAQAEPGASARLVGTSTATTGAFTPSGDGDVTQVEFAGETDAEAATAPYAGIITDRSLSSGHGSSKSIAVRSGPRAKSNPALKGGFDGLNLYQQRYARGGNQFTVEPPDQALCVGNGHVLEAVNDVLNVYDTSGASVLPDNTATNIVSGSPRNVDHAVDLNSFFGYAPAINRSTGVRAQFVTDPVCLFDAATQRFFVGVLTLETRPNGSFTTVNHIDMAVSQSANPAGSWNIYRLDVTNDGTNTGGANPGPYLGDYPHIGADANGVYITTNAYPWGTNGFAGAQVYALSKAQLAAGASSVTTVHLDTSGMVPVPSEAGSTQPGFTVWPAQSPGTSSFETAAGGTEYFLSSNAADEATHPVSGSVGSHQSNQVVVWALTNTSSLNTSTPAVSLSAKVLGSEMYAIPPKAQQLGAGSAPTTATPQGFCINDTTTATIAGAGCWRLLFGGQPAHNEVVSKPDSNDTRMQQVMYANGKLWGALDTAVNPTVDSVPGPQRAGIAWFIVKPSVASGSLTAKMALQGYLGRAGADLTYPAIGVTPSGRGVMAFSYTDDTTFPSAGYASIDALVGTGPISIAKEGAATDDGFTSYKAQVGDPPRTRWGDYSAAAVDGSSVWIASEYVANACNYTTWGGPFFTGGTGDNLLGTCAGASHGPGVRTAIGNWSTRVSQLTP